METETHKCVIVVAEELPVGLAVNAAAVLAVTLGGRVASLVGPDVMDGSGEVHAGLIKVTLPILKARGNVIKQIKARAGLVNDVRVVDLTVPAQTARTYEEYVERMASLTDEQLDYIGVALYGGRQSVNKLTGNLSLLR